MIRIHDRNIAIFLFKVEQFSTDKGEVDRSFYSLVGEGLLVYRNNVLFLSRYLESNDKKIREDNGKTASIIELGKRRQEVLTEERRKVKRTILADFVSGHVVVPLRGLEKVNLHDMSNDGLSFDLEFGRGSFKKDEELAMRIYVNRETYFPFTIKVRRLQFSEDEQVYRVGASLVNGTFNERAIHHFIQFIENISMSLRTDKGDVVVSKING